MADRSKFQGAWNAEIVQKHGEVGKIETRYSESKPGWCKALCTEVGEMVVTQGGNSGALRLSHI